MRRLIACAVPEMVAAQTKPHSVKAVGPWEAVQWVRGSTVSRCTLIRETKPADAPGYGIPVDQEGTLLSVETTAWQLTPNLAVSATLKPRAGAIRRLTARPMSQQRANVDISKDRAMLDDLQRSEQLEVQIGAVKVKLPFDDFNAARVVLESCVMTLGKATGAAR